MKIQIQGTLVETKNIRDIGDIRIMMSGTHYFEITFINGDRELYVKGDDCFSMEPYGVSKDELSKRVENRSITKLNKLRDRIINVWVANKIIEIPQFNL